MHLISTASADPDISTTGHRAWRLADDQQGGDAGLVSVVELGRGFEEAGAGHAEAEQVHVVLSGEVRVVAGAWERRAGAGSVVFVPRRTGCQLVATAPSRLLQIYAGRGAPNLPADTSRAEAESNVAVVRIDETAGVPMTEPAMGMHDIVSRVLVSSDTTNARAVLVGHAEYAPGRGLHELHRHESAGEFVYVFSGAGYALLDDGELALSTGDLAYVAPGEWHGLRAAGGEPTETIFGFLGAASFADIGYALRH